MIQDFMKPRYSRALTRPVPALSLKAGKLVWVGAASALALSGGAAIVAGLRQTSTPATSSSTPVETIDVVQPVTNTSPASPGTEAAMNIANDSTHVDVRVNGESIAVPDNGTTQQTFSNIDGSTTEVKIDTDQHASGSSSRSSVNIHSHTSSSSSATSTVDSRIRSIH
jgi:hypothetical protein